MNIYTFTKFYPLQPLLKSVVLWSVSAIVEKIYLISTWYSLLLQLVDDVLDFVASDAEMGKPTAADLKLGLATAPVLFACEKVGIET